MTLTLPSRDPVTALMDAAVEASKAGDLATCISTLLAAAQASDAEGRRTDAERIRVLVRTIGDAQ